METTTQVQETSRSVNPRTNGLTEEQKKLLREAAGRHKNDPDYIKRVQEGVATYRRQLQEEWEREAAENEGK